jgi:hypothetical protein
LAEEEVVEQLVQTRMVVLEVQVDHQEEEAVVAVPEEQVVQTVEVQEEQEVQELLLFILGNKINFYYTK